MAARPVKIKIAYPDGETDEEKVQPGVRCEELIKIATSEVSYHDVTLTDDMVLTLVRFDKATKEWKEITDPLNPEKKETLRVIVKKAPMIKVEFNGNQFSIRQDVGVQELKQLFLKESDMRLERKDDEDGIWFEVVDIDDADLCEGAVFRAKKICVPCPKKYCISMCKHNEYLVKMNIYEGLSKKIPSWIPEYRRWWLDGEPKKGKPLLVYFINSCPWKYSGDPINTRLVLDKANGWGNCFQLAGKKEDSHIRVKFHDVDRDGPSAGNWSMLGSAAGQFKRDPTMFLDLNEMTDKQIDTTIKHQFGHALGLGHALMSEEEWAILMEYVDASKMRESLGLTDKHGRDLEMQWTGKGAESPHYDPKSVMLYSAELQWKTSKYPNDNAVHYMDQGPERDVLLQFNNRLDFEKEDLSTEDGNALGLAKGDLPKSAAQLPLVNPVEADPPKEADAFPHAASKPKVADIDYYGVVRDVQDQWPQLGTKLGVTQAKQNSFARKAMQDDYTCCTKVLQDWINRGGYSPRYPLSWKGLYDVLCDMELNETADNMKEKLKAKK